MESRRILSALCYFSLFFAGFIFPVVVYFVSDDAATKNHAKKAFISHVIPLVTVPFFVLGVFVNGGGHGNALPALALFSMALFGLASFIVMVWNIVKGVQVLTREF